LLKNSLEGTNSQVTVDRHHAADGPLGCFLLENHMTATLPDASEP